jgi:hypothetical protein
MIVMRTLSAWLCCYDTKTSLDKELNDLHNLVRDNLNRAYNLQKEQIAVLTKILQDNTVVPCNPEQELSSIFETINENDKDTLHNLVEWMARIATTNTSLNYLLPSWIRFRAILPQSYFIMFTLIS